MFLFSFLKSPDLVGLSVNILSSNLGTGLCLQKTKLASQESLKGCSLLFPY